MQSAPEFEFRLRIHATNAFHRSRDDCRISVDSSFLRSAMTTMPSSEPASQHPTCVTTLSSTQIWYERRLSPTPSARLPSETERERHGPTDTQPRKHEDVAKGNPKSTGLITESRRWDRAKPQRRGGAVEVAAAVQSSRLRARCAVSVRVYFLVRSTTSRVPFAERYHQEPVRRS